MTWRKTFVFLLLMPALAACAPVAKDGQPTVVQSATILRSGQDVGQTFTARDAGLNGVQVFLSPNRAGAGEIQLHLRANVQATTDLAVATLSAQAVGAPGFYRFAFAPQRDSRGRDYYAVLDVRGDDEFRVGAASGDTYLDGALYQNDQPVDAQMAFRLTYDPIELSIGLASLAVTWLQVLVITILLFILPGWALLAWLLPGWNALSWGERLGLASGLSLAVYPLFMLWTSLVGLRLGALYAWLPIAVAIGALVWRNRTWRPRQTIDAWREAGWNDLALVVLIGLIVGVRFWVIRSLNVPMWGDSYQHTMIAQLIVDHGGLFNSWAPYAELQTFTYHFGFHTAAAVFHWISGLDLPQAVLWTGQVLNGLAVLALYPLATWVSKNRWVGVVGVLIGGLLSPMPMGYVNWGRYTQLAGQTILPAAICLGWAALETKHRDWRVIGLAWTALSGLAVTHYRILIFAALFFIAYFLFNLTLARIRVTLARTLVLAIGGGLLFLPWFVHVFAGKLMSILGAQLSTPAATVSGWTQEYNAVGNVFSYLPVYLWLLLSLSIVWGLVRREKRMVVFSVWWFLILLAANPQWLHLPGEGALTNFAVFIAAYIPASVLIGATVGWLMAQRHSMQVSALVFAFVCALGLWGAHLRLTDVNLAQSALVTQPDQRAAAWIRQNIPANAVFLVNTFFAYGNSSVVGSDGGWWLPLLAGRQITLPPLTYVSEKGPRLDFREWINLLPSEIQAKGIANPQVVALLHERGITHIYIGQRQGQVNAPGPALLSIEQLLASPEFRCIYHQDRVWIFEVVP